VVMEGQHVCALSDLFGSSSSACRARSLLHLP